MAATETLVKAIKACERPGYRPTGRKSIVVCTPTLGTVSMWWTTAMLDMVWPMNMGKGLMPMMDNSGGEIAETRNRLVQMVLSLEQAQNVGVEAIMWIDDDVIVNRAALLSLAQHDRDIASGVYFCKGETGSQPLIFPGPSSGTLPFVPDTTFEAWGWATGLCLIKLDVYKRMEAELPLGLDKYGSPNWYKVPEFKLEEDGSLTTGGTEDFHFFKNAYELGYSALVDCSKFAFGWHYDLTRKEGHPKKQWAQFLAHKPITWDTKEGVVVWD